MSDFRTISLCNDNGITTTAADSSLRDGYCVFWKLGSKNILCILYHAKHNQYIELVGFEKKEVSAMIMLRVGLYGHITVAVLGAPRKEK